jgi:CHAT domain-containing protein/Flp pilus assembly protein TadD
MYEAGLCSDVKAGSMLEHAADCPACGTLLADLRGGEFGGMRDGQSAIEPQKTILLRSNTPEWKRDMLGRIAREMGTEAAPSGVRSWLARLSHPGYAWAAAAAAAALVVVASGVWWISSRNTPQAAFSLIAQAYSEQRPFELRIDGAKHAPYEPKRGAAGSPALPLLDAQRLIADKQHSGDTAWLRAKARAELLEWHYTAAIDSLREVQETEPDNPNVLGDLSIAYLQRAEIEMRPQDIAQAIDYLGKALQAAPSDRVLRFNLALAYERQGAPRQAIEEWNHFLKLEPAGPWADEARDHLGKLDEQLKQHAERSRSPRKSEDSITALAAAGFRATPTLDPAAIAADLAENHNDPWLRDFLAANQSAGSAAAIGILETAAKAYATGESSQGEAHARAAVEAFRRARNAPGAGFAAYEQAYGFQRLSDRKNCLHIAQDALPAARDKGYWWLEVQLRMTVAACEMMDNRVDAADQALVQAQERAERAGFSGLTLRTMVLRAELLRQVGSYRDAMKLDEEGLRRYWSGLGNSTLAFQFYYEMGMSTAGLRHLRAAAALLNEAVQLAALLPDRYVEAMVRARYADVLIEDGRSQEAGKQFDQSEGALKGMTESAASQLYSSYAELSRARLDGLQNPGNGLQRLDRMESNLSSIRNAAVEALLWRIKSELLTKAGRLEESDRALRRILSLGDSARAASVRIGDPSELGREVYQAVNLLTDRSLQRGDAAEAWRIWTRYNPCFRTSSGRAGGTVRLLYTELPSGLVVLVSDASGIRAQRLQISSSSLQRLALNFGRALASHEPMERVRSLGQRLYAQVIAPIEPGLAGAAMLQIAADGDFASIPFTALVSSDGRWLADQYRVAYSPPLAGVSQSAPAGLAPNLRVVAAAYGQATKVFQTVLPSVPDVDFDIHAISSTLPNNRLLQSKDATLPSLLAALPGAGIFHFSGHAVVTAGDAALVLAAAGPDDSERLLWASRIPRQSLRSCHLVMLAACSTGRAASEDNDPSSAMARAFLLTGVPEVIAARWDVDSRAASALVAQFYRAVGEGASAGDALALSTQQLRQQSAFAHPYYWAAFDLFRS